MVRHGMGHNLLPPSTEQHFLQPVESMTARTGIEKIQDHEHHPDAESRGHYQIFRTRTRQTFQLLYRHILDIHAIDKNLIGHAYAIQIFGNGGDCPRPYQVIMHSVTCCIISEKEFHPASPEQQATEKSPQGLFRIPFDKHTENHHRKSDRPHGKRRIVKYRRGHG